MIFFKKFFGRDKPGQYKPKVAPNLPREAFTVRLSREGAKIIVEPGTAPDLYNRGVKCYQKRDIKGAMRYFEEAIVHDSQHADARYNLAVIYYELAVTKKDQAMLTKAKKEYEKVIELRPEDVDARLNLGVIYKSTGEEEKGREQFENVINRNPNYELAYAHLGDYHLKRFLRRTGLIELVEGRAKVGDEITIDKEDLTQFAQALCHFQKALEIDPSCELAKTGMGIVLKLERDVLKRGRR